MKIQENYNDELKIVLQALYELEELPGTLITPSKAVTIILRELDNCYTGGLFDGEGCATAPQPTMLMQDKEILEFLKDRYGGRVGFGSKAGFESSPGIFTKRDTWYWTHTGPRGNRWHWVHKLKFYRDILPYMKGRRKIQEIVDAMRRLGGDGSKYLREDMEPYEDKEPKGHDAREVFK